MNVNVGVRDGSMSEGRTVVGVSGLIEDPSVFLEGFLFLKPGFAIRTRFRDGGEALEFVVQEKVCEWMRVARWLCLLA